MNSKVHPLQLNFILGTAAELIKVYPIIQLALERGHGVRVLSTGQSRENFQMQYRDLRLPADNLAMLLEHSQDLETASSALRWFSRAITVRKPQFLHKLLRAESGQSLVVVHGDTLSTLVGAWLGWRTDLRVVHVEAGLRSPQLFSPFPEEITRRLVSRLTDLHLAPDAFAATNLRRGHPKRNIVMTNGNSLRDAVHLAATLGPAKDITQPFALVNIHRFENLNSRDRWQ